MICELTHDNELLSQVCAPATADDAGIAQDLIDTMESLDDCSCLAANQIGQTKAVVVYRDDAGEDHVLYNPKLIMGLRPQRTVEGCLSHEEYSQVKRFDKIKVSYDELVDGELKGRRRDFTGWIAQMIQHMIDHCQGKLV
jgi:peptide deformylase